MKEAPMAKPRKKSKGSRAPAVTTLDSIAKDFRAHDRKDMRLWSAFALRMKSIEDRFDNLATQFEQVIVTAQAQAESSRIQGEAFQRMAKAYENMQAEVQLQRDDSKAQSVNFDKMAKAYEAQATANQKQTEAVEAQTKALGEIAKAWRDAGGFIRIVKWISIGAGAIGGLYAFGSGAVQFFKHWLPPLMRSAGN